jgi:MYXO-CTERM domain-containing protein
MASNTAITLAAGADIDVDDSVNFAATPAPSNALLAVAGMPVLGLMWMVRRRRSNVDSAAPAIA